MPDEQGQADKTSQAVVFKDGRKRSFLNFEGVDKPLKSPVPHETLVRARGYRLSLIRRLLAEHDCAPFALFYQMEKTQIIKEIALLYRSAVTYEQGLLQQIDRSSGSGQLGIEPGKPRLH